MHNFTESMLVGNWEINISPTTSYGYFENIETGAGGGLWFVDNELVDYDGVYMLPSQICKSLRDTGYYLDDAYFEV